MDTQSKAHLALNTSHFDASVRFYRAFLGIEPAKLKPGYAKFDSRSPAINLTLNESAEDVPRGALNHLGIQVTSTAEVNDARDRLAGLGFSTREEKNVDCCYALQDKFWVEDPDGNPWEIFFVKQADTRPDLKADGGPRPAAPCC